LSLENVKKIFTGKCDGSELSPLEFALDFLNKRSAMEFYSSSPESHPFWVRKNVNGKGYSKFSEFLSDNEPKANEIFAQEMSEKSKTGINVISKSPANSENVSVEVYVSPVSFFVRKEQKNDRLFIRKEMEKHNVLALANMFDFANFSEEKIVVLQATELNPGTWTSVMPFFGGSLPTQQLINIQKKLNQFQQDYDLKPFSTSKEEWKVEDDNGVLTEFGKEVFGRLFGCKENQFAIMGVYSHEAMSAKAKAENEGARATTKEQIEPLLQSSRVCAIKGSVPHFLSVFLSKIEKMITEPEFVLGGVSYPWVRDAKRFTSFVSELSCKSNEICWLTQEEEQEEDVQKPEWGCGMNFPRVMKDHKTQITQAVFKNMGPSFTSSSVDGQQVQVQGQGQGSQSENNQNVSRLVRILNVLKQNKLKTIFAALAVLGLGGLAIKRIVDRNKTKELNDGENDNPEQLGSEVAAAA